MRIAWHCSRSGWTPVGHSIVEREDYANQEYPRIFEVDFFDEGLIREIRVYGFSDAGRAAFEGDNARSWDTDTYRGELLERYTVVREEGSFSVNSSLAGFEERFFYKIEIEDVTSDVPVFQIDALRLFREETGAWVTTRANGDVTSEVQFLDDSVSVSTDSDIWPATFRYNNGVLVGYSKESGWGTAEYEIISHGGGRYEIAGGDRERYYVKAPELVLDEPTAAVNEYMIRKALSTRAEHVVSAFSLWSRDTE